MLSSLAREAAELLWEMVATEDIGDAMQQMRENATTIQAQLRGLIGDYSDPDEGALAAGLESYDMLNNVLEEQSEAAPQGATGGVEFGGRPAASSADSFAVPPPSKAAPAAPQFGGASPATPGSGDTFAAAAPPPRQPPPSGLIDDAPSGKQEERPLMEF